MTEMKVVQKLNSINKSTPALYLDEYSDFFEEAECSERKRVPKIMHKKGDYFNSVFNFMLEDSYMHPHLHPSKEKIEKMYLIEGSFCLIIFDDHGNIIEKTILKEDVRDYIAVPAYTWHTYVMLSERVIVYETMEGKYEPDTWKEMADWAPLEGSPDAISYLEYLKNSCI
jgi:cupin fold WbuC family metalloprotein